MIRDKNIDHGKGFDWGKASEDYGKYRDIYPPEFFEKITGMGLCIKGQKVLDLGTGTGVLPRNMYHYGAEFTGADISEQQIQKAKELSDYNGMKINYIVSSAENIDFPDNTFDVVTACQCFMYFDKSIVLPKLHNILKPNGQFAILLMAWLPDESSIAKQSEELVLKYNPSWTGCHMQRYSLDTPDWCEPFFDTEHKIAFDINVPFTRDSWNGRIRACRGIGASLSDDQIKAFDREHKKLLEEIAPETFNILHYATMLILKVKNK